MFHMEITGGGATAERLGGRHTQRPRESGVLMDIDTFREMFYMIQQ